MYSKSFDEIDRDETIVRRIQSTSKTCFRIRSKILCIYAADFFIGLNYFDINEDDPKIMACMTTALEYEPDIVYIIRWVGAYCYNQGKYKQAIDYLNRIKDENENYKEQIYSWIILSYAYLKDRDNVCLWI